MKTNYSVPEISSLAENEIKDLQDISFYLPELRIVELPGISVRIEFNKDGYIETKSRKEVDLSKYFDIFNTVKNFFFGTGYLFGRVSDGNLLIYDAYTNDNFLSTKDMKYLKNVYNLPIVQPIAEGRFTFRDVINIFSEKEDLSDLFILPSMYLNDNRSYTSSIKPQVISNVIIGEKKTYNYFPSTSTTNVTPVNTTPKPVVPVTPVKVEEKLDVFEKSTKEERTSILEEVTKNINKRIVEKAKDISNEALKWYTSFGKTVAHLYAIHTLPSTRYLVYDFAKEYWNPYYVKGTIYDKWGAFFLDFFVDRYGGDLFSKYPMYEDNNDYHYFAEIFEDEFKAFEDFYNKEADLLEDWRTGGLYDFI